MAIFTINLNGQSKVLDTGRFVSGGAAHMEVRDWFTSIANVVGPNVTTSNVMNAQTITLVSYHNVLRPNANTTSFDQLANNVTINFPASPTDGLMVRIATTNTITNVAGGLANVSNCVPNVATLFANTPVQFRYDALTKLWLSA